MASSVKDGDWGIGRDSHIRGLGLETNLCAETGRELARRFGHGKDGGAIGYTHNSACLVFVADDIARPESE
jgi:hypothetical protein